MRKAWILFGVALLGCGGGDPAAVDMEDLDLNDLLQNLADDCAVDDDVRGPYRMEPRRRRRHQTPIGQPQLLRERFDCRQRVVHGDRAIGLVR